MREQARGKGQRGETTGQSRGEAREPLTGTGHRLQTTGDRRGGRQNPPHPQPLSRTGRGEQVRDAKRLAGTIRDASVLGFAS